jgi:hypothetical protein
VAHENIGVIPGTRYGAVFARAEVEWLVAAMDQAALLTIATRRSDNLGPATNGVVSNAGQGILPGGRRVGSGMSSRRAICVSPSVKGIVI